MEEADMTRREAQMNGMLRHLGAAYYESLHGRAAPADVARARAAVEEALGEGHPRGTGSANRAGPRVPGEGKPRTPHSWRWHTRVGDVMTTNVVTVDRITKYKEIAALLTRHHISAVPVLTMGRHVAGVVSEADLLKLEDKHAREVRAAGRAGHRHWPGTRRDAHWGTTAAEMMTSPAISVKPDATIAGAARLMNAHHVKRLPVVDGDGKLIGIVSRRDLLTVFLRPDAVIASEVRQLLAEILFTDPEHIAVHVRGGVVTLDAGPGLETDPDLVPVAIRLVWDIDGVVDVVSKLSMTAPAAPA
jgi:CBS domain-containing protein